MFSENVVLCWRYSLVIMDLPVVDMIYNTAAVYAPGNLLCSETIIMADEAMGDPD